MIELWRHLWPFRVPVESAGRLGDRLERAGQLLYWSGVAHGVLGAMIATAVAAGVVLLARRGMTRGCKLSVGMGLLGVLLWYSGQLAKAPPPAPAAPRVEPARPEPKLPRKRPH